MENIPEQPVILTKPDNNVTNPVTYIFKLIKGIWCTLSTPEPPGTLRFALKVAVWITIVIYGFIPFIIYQFDDVGRILIFQTFLRKHPLDFTHPEIIDIKGIRNLYVDLGDNNSLGVWHILPNELLNELQETDEFYNEALKKKYPVFLYFHGITGSRAAPHRVALYQVLQKMNCHVLTFDYRCFGDSSDAELISESTLVEDGKCMILWVEKNIGESPFYAWGHSLGAAVLVHTMFEITDYAYQPQGVVIESAFNNLLTEVMLHPLTSLYQWMPGFYSFMLGKLTRMDLLFESDKYIGFVKLPLLMLHAKDDRVIPCRLGLELYECAIKTRNETSKPVKMMLFSEKFGFGHRNIILSKHLHDIIQMFFTKWSDGLDSNSIFAIHHMSNIE